MTFRCLALPFLTAFHIDGTTGTLKQVQRFQVFVLYRIMFVGLLVCWLLTLPGTTVLLD